MALSFVDTRPELDLQTENLHAAVLYTLAYSDIFDFPLTLDEIHRYLIGRAASSTEVAAVLSTSELQGQLASDDKFYALAGREYLFALRRKRAALAAELWPQALRFGRLIGSLPFVRMVALTGALVSANVEPGADFDYLIVTKPGWLWLNRAMVLALNKLTKALGLRAELCPNYLITQNVLRLQDEDLFTAQELTRMVPISGFDVYANMRAQNRWTEGLLPNATGAPRGLGENKHGGQIKRFIEAILSALPFQWLERWEMQRKIAKFARQNILNAETRFSADFCKGHFDGHKQKTLRAFQDRIARLKVAA